MAHGQLGGIAKGVHEALVHRDKAKSRIFKVRKQLLEAIADELSNEDEFRFFSGYEYVTGDLESILTGLNGKSKKDRITFFTNEPHLNQDGKAYGPGSYYYESLSYQAIILKTKSSSFAIVRNKEKQSIDFYVKWGGNLPNAFEAPEPDFIRDLQVRFGLNHTVIHNMSSNKITDELIEGYLGLKKRLTEYYRTIRDRAIAERDYADRSVKRLTAIQKVLIPESEDI
jgi:hypothetical protein